MKSLFIILIVVAILSCSTHEQFTKIVRSKRVTEETDSICRTKFYYKNEPLNGKYKIKKHCFFNNTYGIWNVKDGYFDGCYSYYIKGKPDYRAWYKNGLINGNEIHYNNGKIRTSTMYEKGFLLGSDILYDYNGVDTALVIDYHTDENKMDVYLDEYFLESNKIIYIGLLQNTCFLKAQEYQQNFYSRKDSSLLHRNIWIREEDGEYELKY